MKILFHLGHPAHFHLFKNVIQQLQENGHQTDILIKEKDVLRELLDSAGFAYHNILPEGKSPGRVGMVKDLLKRGRRIISFCKEHRPNLLIGTSADISYVGKFLGIPSINVQEDDASIIPLHAWLAYPWATAILSPDCCDNGRWNKKTTTYAGYHELAYLHPDHFTPNLAVAEKYLGKTDDYFILRFANLHAHHDGGVRGIGNKLATELVNRLKPHGRVFITSERELSAELEPYRLTINPMDIHHLLAFAKAVIGDSQTMSAEAGVLGTPYIRYNDFVGKIGYLNELEEKYKLGYGITPDYPDQLLSKAEELASGNNVKAEIQKRREKMLSVKINVADFLIRFVEKFMEGER